MLPPAINDLDRRRKAWNAMAEPFCDFAVDEQTMPEDYHRIGSLISSLGYTDDDARKIYWSEVVPVVESFWLWIDVDDSNWLVDRIRHPRRLRFYAKCLLFPLWIWIDRAYWREIKRGIMAARDIKAKSVSEPFES